MSADGASERSGGRPDDRSARAEIAFEGLVRVLRLEPGADVPPDGDVPLDGDDGLGDGLGADERLVLRYLHARAARSTARSTARSAAGAPRIDATAGTGEDAAANDAGAPAPDPDERGAARDTAQDAAQNAEEDEREGTMGRGPSGIPKTGLPAETTASEPDRVSLPNARTHGDYAARIGGYTDLALVDDGGSGLRVDARGAVAGAGLAAGEYTLVLSGHRDDANVAIHARVSVIADPRDLWRDRPSDRDTPHWKPDRAAETRSGEDGLVIAASRRGRAHAHEGACRDDDFALHVAPGAGGWHVLAVADGAGSAPLSRAGSAAACGAARAALARSLTDDTTDPTQPLLDAARTAASAVATLAADEGRAVGDYATTLLLAVARRQEDRREGDRREGDRREGRWEFAAFCVGDGAVVLYDAEADEGMGEAVPLCRPDGGEFAGQTRFLDAALLDAPDAGRRVFAATRPRFTALVAMTDGVTDPKFPTILALADADGWREVWTDLGPVLLGPAPSQPISDPARPGGGERLLDWLDFWSRGDHDDRTLAALLPGADPLPDGERAR